MSVTSVLQIFSWSRAATIDRTSDIQHENDSEKKVNKCVTDFKDNVFCEDPRIKAAVMSKLA